MGEHKKETHVVEFECHHTRIFIPPTPKVGDILWCPRCNGERKVITAPAEFRIRCQNCIYSRPFGAAKLNAEIAAAKHRLKNPDHVVRIFNGNEFIRQFPDERVGRNQTVIPMSSERDPSIPF